MKFALVCVCLPLFRVQFPGILCLHS